MLLNKESVFTLSTDSACWTEDADKSPHVFVLWTSWIGLGLLTIVVRSMLIPFSIHFYFHSVSIFAAWRCQSSIQRLASPVWHIQLLSCSQVQHSGRSFGLKVLSFTLTGGSTSFLCCHISQRSRKSGAKRRSQLPPAMWTRKRERLKGSTPQVTLVVC